MRLEREGEGEIHFQGFGLVGHAFRCQSSLTLNTFLMKMPCNKTMG